MTGPTTTGSIDAKLTIDKDGWDEKAAEAKAEARELGELSPEIKVKADVGPALAKLEAVAKAERDLDMAYQRSAISQEKLDAVTNKYGEDSVQAAAARLAHSRAIGNEEAAEAKLTRAKQLSTVEEDKNTEATKRGTKANHDRVTGLQVLMALSPAILSAAAPIAAGAVGLGVAFGVMGGAGVLAFKGIKDAMEVGDQVGNTYATGIGVLKTNLDQLEGIAADKMLGAFSGAVGDINEKMPFLNQMVGQSAGLLGQMGGTALSGVLNGLQQMNPLIQMGGVELGKFVAWLFSFSNSNGFAEFINYAQENLPAVMRLIESLVTTAGHILAAFAPLGPVVVGVLTAISDVASSLPLPVLAGLVTMGTAIGPAFRIAAAGVGLFAIESQFAVPVVGVLLAAITGLGVMAATAAIGTNQGTGALNSYTQALKEDNDALGEHVRMQGARALSDAGAFDAARQLGIDQKTLTDALLGSADAQNRVNDAIAKGKSFQNDWSQGVVDANSGMYIATDAQNKMGAAIDTVTKTLGSQKAALQQSQQTNKDLAAASDATTGATKAQTTAAQLLSNQFGATTSSIQAAQDAQDKTAQSTADATTKMQMQSDAAGLLKAALDGLNGKSLSAAQAQNAFDSSLANMGDHVDKTGKKITFTTTSITDMSSASVALRGQLNGQVANLMQVVEANGGLSNSTGAAKKQMEDMRQQIIDNAVAHGVDKDAVTNYIDQIMQIPDSVPPTKTDVDTAESLLKVHGLQSAIDSLTGKTIDIYSVEHIQQVRDGPAVNGISGNAIANSMDAANAFATGASGYSTGGSVYRAGGGPVSYLDGGGFPGGPRGTDTVPTWLTPEEYVVRRSSAKAIGKPALDYINETGQLPGSGPVNVTVYIGGEAVDSRMVQIVQQQLGGVARQIGGMRR